MLPNIPENILLIKEIVCKEMGLPVKRLTENNRKREVVYPRQVCIYFIKKMIRGITYKEVADSIRPGMNHATAIHAERVIRNLCRYREFENKFMAISTRLECTEDMGKVSLENEMVRFEEAIKRSSTLLQNIKRMPTDNTLKSMAKLITSTKTISKELESKINQLIPWEKQQELLSSSE